MQGFKWYFNVIEKKMGHDTAQFILLTIAAWLREIPWIITTHEHYLWREKKANKNMVYSYNGIYANAYE